MFFAMCGLDLRNMIVRRGDLFYLVGAVIDRPLRTVFGFAKRRGAEDVAPYGIDEIHSPTIPI